MKISEGTLTVLTARIHETQLQINKLMAIHQQDLLALTNLAEEWCVAVNDHGKTVGQRDMDMLDQRFYMWENIGEGG